ncbi:asparaginase [Radiobacillus sp. PE A8.2]|uniref:asparaginase n=1 Tax=Radiobacillus sp. PE A8.2 TaxID=3380349 RepID=UPI00388F0D3B
MKKILLLHTGGTISMVEDKQTGLVSTTDAHPLVDITAMVTDAAEIEEVQLFNIPSPHMTPTHMLALGQKVHEKLATNTYHGVVITHGTDTLEETAYFLDLYLQTSLPVVITGAMRSSNELGSDGLYNLISSIRVASSDEAKGKGVLVVMNDEIHTARYVTKTSTSNVATFQSPQLGPIGIITKQAVYFHQLTVSDESFPIQQVSKKVALLKAYAGMDASFIQALYNSGIDGLVLEGLGQGNIPQDAVSAIEEMIQQGIPIVMVSRCYQGVVQPTYSYEGGGGQLKKLGVIFAKGLSGPKARIKLLIALEITNTPCELAPMFDR